jgi:hypothetical protein
MESTMNVNRMIRIIAGTFVLISLALGAPGCPVFVSAYWLWFTAFVGANLLQSGLTRFCPMDNLLKKLGFQDTPDGRQEGPKAKVA